MENDLTNHQIRMLQGFAQANLDGYWPLEMSDAARIAHENIIKGEFTVADLEVFNAYDQEGALAAWPDDE